MAKNNPCKGCKYNTEEYLELYDAGGGDLYTVCPMESIVDYPDETVCYAFEREKK